MKILLISLQVLRGLVLSSMVLLAVFCCTSRASAEPTFAKSNNVVTMVVKNMKKESERYSFSFEKPITTLLKPCVTENGSHRVCIYEVKGNKEIYVFDYTDSDDMMVVYTFETKVEAAGQ